MFKQAYQQAIASIEAARQRSIEAAKQKAMQEQIVPYNAEIDASLRDALTALQNQHNAEIAELQADFEAEKKTMIEAATKKKSDYAESIMATATNLINHDADRAIKNLQDFIDKQGA